MKNNRKVKFLSTFLSFALVLSLLVPYASATANATANPFKTEQQSESVLQQKAAVADQLQLLKQTPRLHKDLEGVKGDQNVDVIILLSEKPVALEQGIKELAGKKFTSSDAKAATSKVQAQHKFLKKEMTAQKISFKEGFSYSTVLNGFSASVKANDLNKLLEIDGVTLVEPDSEVHAYEDTSAATTSDNDLAMDTSISFLGIEDIWDEGYEGEGIKVAVLDTGIDYEHPEFAEIYKGGFNFVPHTGSDYTKPRADDDPYETTPSERPASKPEFNANGSSFYTSHGTHVAGTIAAIGDNEYGIKGIAPKVDLYAYRVLGAYGSGSNAGVIAGINKAVEEGMDVINLSLGGGSNDSTTADTIAINNAMLAGTVSVLATGNSGSKRGTIGTPAAAALGIAVGNTTNPETMHNGTVSVVAGSFELSKDLNFMGTTYGTNLADQLAGEFELVPVPGVGTVANFDGIDVTGKVALIARGEIAFVDKIANAKAKGAVATIIHNSSNGSNAPGISDVFLGDDFEFLPTVDMSYTDGTAIRAALASSNGTVTFGEFASETSTGDAVNDSSSRGPTKPHFDIKPDVSAPGTNIMSSVPRYGKEVPDADYSTAFERFTGTSMAAPHIAGIAALILDANPEWNAFDVKVALSNTAKVLDTEKYDVFAQGPGRVQPYKAAFPAALAYAEDTVVIDGKGVANDKGTVTFGHLPGVAYGDVSSTKQVRVENLSGNPSDYDVTVKVTKAFGDAKVTVDTTSFTLGEEQLLNVKLEASQADAPAGSELLGYIHISDGVTELSLPFAVDFSSEGVVEPVDPEKMNRISGIDRYQTALEISSEGWESAETVIIARGNDFADALAGVPLAYAFEAPILLTLTDELSDDVLEEIERLGATTAIILGGNAAVSEEVSKELVNANIGVTRAGGDDRFATAAAIAELIAPNGADEVVIANGLNFPDALSVASHAAQAGTPILLTLKDSIPAETADALESLGTTKTVVVGGTAVVSEAVASKLPSANRLGGLDRYETNTLIANHYGVDNDHLYVATGRDYADALTGAVLAANANSAVLLVHAIVPGYVSSYITEQEVQRLTIFGGENAVSAKVYNELERLID